MGVALAVLFVLTTPSFARPVDKLTIAAIDDVVAGDEGWIIAIDDVAADAGGWITAVDNIAASGGVGVATYAAEASGGFAAFGDVAIDASGSVVAFGNVEDETPVPSFSVPSYWGSVDANSSFASTAPQANFVVVAEATPIWADIHFHQYMTIQKDKHVRFKWDPWYGVFDDDTDFYVDIFAVNEDFCRYSCGEGQHKYISYDYNNPESQQRMKDFLTNHTSLFSGVKTVRKGELSFVLGEELESIEDGQHVIVIYTPQYIEDEKGKEWSEDDYWTLNLGDFIEVLDVVWKRDRQREFKKAITELELATRPDTVPGETRIRPASFSSLYDNHIHFRINSYPLELMGGDLIVGTNIMDGFQSKFLGEISSVGSSLFYQYDFAYAELSWNRLDFKGVGDGDLVKASIGLSYDYGIFHGGLSLSRYIDGETSVNMRGVSIASEQDDEVRANLGMRIDF